jgi:hypothetical protein
VLPALFEGNSCGFKKVVEKVNQRPENPAEKGV